MKLEYPRALLTKYLENRNVALPPDEVETSLQIVDAVFFASMSIEEGEPIRIAVVHHIRGAAGLAEVLDESPGYEQSDEPPPSAWDVTEFEPRPLDVASLAKFARGIEYGAQMIVIGGSGDGLRIEGVARMRPRADGGSVVRIAAPRPGVIVFERGERQLLRFENGQHVRRSVDVLGEHGPVRNAINAIIGDGTGPFGSPTDIDGHRFYSFPEAALLRLIRKMRSTQAGAILALLPQAPDNRTLEAVRYRRRDPMVVSKRIETDQHKRLSAIFYGVDHDNLTSTQVQERDAARDAAEVAREDLEAALEDIAQLSAIDGAVLGGPRLALYGAGYLIAGDKLPAGTVRRALDRSADRWEEYPSRHGARHTAAFSFAHQNPGGVAFVISEDGPVSCAFRIDEHVYVWSVEVLETH
jgi:hypothetical protein